MPKLAALRFVTLTILFLWGYKIFSKDEFSYHKSPLNILLLILGAISIITTIFSTVFYTSFYGAEGRFIGLFTMINLFLLPFFAFNFLREQKTVQSFMVVSFTTATILSIYGLLQFFGIFQESFNWSQDPTVRVFGTIGQSNHFGAYIGMNILLGCGLYTWFKNKKLSGLYVMALLLQTIALLLSTSRGAVFAVIVTFLFFSIAALKHQKILKKWFKKYIFPLLLFLTTILIAVGLLWPSIGGKITNIGLINRTIGTIHFIQEGNVPDRLSWWKSTLEMVENKPFLGFGLSTFRDVYNNYRRLDYTVPGPGEVQDLITPEAAHNEYLNIAATQGLIGLISFLALLYFIFKPSKHHNSEDFTLALSVKTALMVYLVQIFISFGVITTLTIFYLLVGISISLANPLAKIQKISLGKNIKYPAIIILMFFLCIAGYATFYEARAEYYYKQATIADAQGDMKNIIVNFQNALNDKPHEYAYHQAYADILLKNILQSSAKSEAKEQLLKLAIINYNEAINLNSNHPNLFYNLGLAELEIFKLVKQDTFYQTASTHFTKAVNLAVNNPLYPYQVAKAYLKIDTPPAQKQAIIFLQKALSIRPFFRDSAIILQQLGVSPKPLKQ